MIKFIKIATYDTGKGKVDRYDYACNLLNQSIDPSSMDAQSIDCRSYSVVICSPALRARNSILTKEVQVVEYLDNLKEIKFNLSKLVSAEEYQAHKSDAVRQAFIDEFAAGRLENFSAIETEVAELVNRLARLNEPIIIISHSFRLKVIEAFIKSRGQLFKNPEMIKQYMAPHKKLYEFKGGFEIEPMDLKFAIILTDK